MSENPPARATWFKFYGQRYLMGGSLRAETTPDERAVWLDFLALANTGDGRFDISSRDALAAQLLIPRELLDRAVKKFTETRRLLVQYNAEERKETFTIVKWAYYQAPPRSHKKGSAPPSPTSPPTPPSSEKEKEREIERERRGSISAASFSQKGRKTAAEISPLPDIPPHLNFQVKDKLTEKRAKIRELERLLDNPLARQHQGMTEDELRARIERERASFCQMIEDRL